MTHKVATNRGKQSQRELSGENEELKKKTGKKMKDEIRIGALRRRLYNHSQSFD
jgi:ribosomal protein S25